MDLLGKLDATRSRARSRSGGSRKSWTQPPFWAADNLRLPFLSSYPLKPDREAIEADFEGYIRGAFKADGIVFSLILARMWVFSEARFQWRKFSKGRPGNLFGDQALALLERPWPNGTTGELLAHMEQDASLAGNFWATTADDLGRLGLASADGTGRRIVRMRPDRVSIVIGSRSGNPNALDAAPIGIIYKAPATAGYPEVETLLLPSEVCHYSPIPDPEARFRGMSWLTPIIREIEGDRAATAHKANFYQNAAVPNLVVKFDKETGSDEFDDFVEKFNEKHRGAWNAYKTLFLMGGADVQPLTMDFKQLDFAATQGKGESRIASAAGVPPSWVGFSEGLQGSALNAGNFGAARRRFADGTIKPLWRMAAASLESLLVAPDGASLWYDDRDIAFIREDERDRAEIAGLNSRTIRTYTDAGFESDSAVLAVIARDESLLMGHHTGLFSVQLQPPGTSTPEDDAEPLDEQGTTTVTDPIKLAGLISRGWKVAQKPHHDSPTDRTDPED